MAAPRCPNGLGSGGKSLWREVAEAHELDVSQRVQLEEACRAKDRLDKLDLLLRGDADCWARVYESDGGEAVLVIDKAIDKANTTANLMKQLLAALRLPDAATGKQPQQRGGARGAYAPKSNVSSLERARAAKSS